MWIYHFPGNCSDHSQNSFLLGRKTLSLVILFPLPTHHSLCFLYLALCLLWAITCSSVVSYPKRYTISTTIMWGYPPQIPCLIGIYLIWLSAYLCVPTYVHALPVAWRVLWCRSLDCTWRPCSQPEPSQWGGAMEEDRGGRLGFLYLHLPQVYSPGVLKEDFHFSGMSVSCVCLPDWSHSCPN